MIVTDKGKMAADELVALGHRLRCLMNRPVTTRADLPAWYAEAQSIIESLSPEAPAPEVFWHWLSDADIRLRDPEYAKMQNEQMERLVADLERGRLPE